MGTSELSLDRGSKSEFVAAGLVLLSCFAFAASAIDVFGANVPIWFANAVALAALVRHRPGQWKLVLIAAAIADAGARLLFGGVSDLPLALSDLVDILLAAAAIHLSGGIRAPLFAGGQLARLILACMLAPAVGSLLAAGWLASADGSLFMHIWITRYLASTLGLLVLTPFLLSWTDPELRRAELTREALLSADVQNDILAAAQSVASGSATPAAAAAKLQSSAGSSIP